MSTTSADTSSVQVGNKAIVYTEENGSYRHHSLPSFAEVASKFVKG